MTLYNTDDVIKYWINGSEEDFKTAQSLFQNERFVHALFFCHLTLEKILKGLVVQKMDSHAPFDHNLIRLSEMTGLSFSNDQNSDLVIINTFNIKGRYDDYKSKFTMKATKEYTENYFNKTKKIFLWLKQQIKK